MSAGRIDRDGGEGVRCTVKGRSISMWGKADNGEGDSCTHVRAGLNTGKGNVPGLGVFMGDGTMCHQTFQRTVTVLPTFSLQLFTGGTSKSLRSQVPGQPSRNVSDRMIHKWKYHWKKPNTNTRDKPCSVCVSLCALCQHVCVSTQSVNTAQHLLFVCVSAGMIEA